MKINITEKLVIDINSFDEDKKAELRKIIRESRSTKPNIEIFIKQDDKEISCGLIEINDELKEKINSL